jgi:MoxR-like ATPase
MNSPSTSSSWRYAAVSSVTAAGSPKLSRCHAALRGRDYVIPEDVKAVAVPELAHRLALRPELWVQRLRPDDIVTELLDRVPTPKAEVEPVTE